MSSNERQKAIEDLITNYAIGNQEELIVLLEAKHGIESTQAVVSRDLKALGCVKKIENKKRIYTLPAKDTQREILRLAVKSIEYNEVMIVVNTGAGLAPFVGDTIDQLDLNLLGTLAGENVVFVSPKSIKDIKNVVVSLKKLVGLNKDGFSE
jgi:transcriptional regulator of arginine metabolism